MSPSKLRILIIDDNPSIHKDFIKILTWSRQQSENISSLEDQIFDTPTINEKDTIHLPEFQIDTASQGEIGLNKIIESLQEGYPYALAFVDMRMPPGWDGIETIKKIWEVDKNIQVIICTAYSDYTWEDTIRELGPSDNLLILKKPFDNIAVRQLACALTKKWELMNETQKYLEVLEDKITERTYSLEKSLSLTRATLESSTDGILVIDTKNQITDYNNRFVEIWKIPPLILESKDNILLKEYILSRSLNEADVANKMDEIIANPDESYIDTLTTKEGRVLEYYSQSHKLNGDIMGRVWSFRDITERVTLEKKLQHQATHDSMTNLPNRFAILQQIQIAIDENKKGEHVAILFMDLDRFKLINDSLGHNSGDQLIKKFAQRLKKFIDPTHIASRLGGDEFIMLIKEIKNVKEVKRIANKILKMSNKAFIIANRKVIISTSIGISLSPLNGIIAEDLLRFADSAMYYAKELGTNQIQFYTDELNRKSLQRLEQETDLRRAIINEEFFLNYQPEVDIVKNKIIAVEALVRWNHPTKGIVLPIDFIPLAEESNLIVSLGEWILKEACRQNKTWQSMGLPPIQVAVNVASHQFKQPNFVSCVARILHDTHLDPQYLKIEVTENTIINDPVVMQTLTQLKELGLSIVLDDFGTGYSSLSYLRKIPLDGLKIDRSFVQNISRDNGDEVIIRAIIAMAHNLNLEILAEGVETEAQLHFLQKYHCEEVQGFYFSHPLASGEIIKILEKLTEMQDINT